VNCWSLLCYGTCVSEVWATMCVFLSNGHPTGLVIASPHSTQSLNLYTYCISVTKSTLSFEVTWCWVGREFLRVNQCVDINGLALAGFCEHGNEPSGSVKCRNFSYVWGSVSFWRRTMLHGLTIVETLLLVIVDTDMCWCCEVVHRLPLSLRCCIPFWYSNNK